MSRDEGLDGALRALVSRVGKPDEAERFASLAGRALSERPGVLCEAAPDDLKSMYGLRDETALLISAIPELAGRCGRETLGEHPALDTPKAAERYASTLFFGSRYERFVMLCLDGRRRLIRAHTLQNGCVNETSFYMRIVVETAIRDNASAAIFAHNHPGGSRRFSLADMTSTRQSVVMLGSIGVALLDHILVARGEPISMRRQGRVSEEDWLRYAGPWQDPP